jgi:hypothetical protein
MTKQEVKELCHKFLLSAILNDSDVWDLRDEVIEIYNNNLCIGDTDIRVEIEESLLASERYGHENIKQALYLRNRTKV